MNRKQIIELFSDATEYEIPSCLEINDVTTNLQSADEKTIVFYKIGKTEGSEKVFLQRLKTAGDCLLILNSKPKDLKQRYIIIGEEKFLEYQKAILDVLYPIEKDGVQLVGVTGTNGKTSVVDLVGQIAWQRGSLAVTIGTVGVGYNDGSISSLATGGTTPSYVIFRKILFEAQEKKCDLCVFEFSSHALVQDRLYDYRLDLAAWTNFTQDHLDYHKTMDNYFDAKMRIARVYLKDRAPMIVPHQEQTLAQKVYRQIPTGNIIKSSPITEALPEHFCAGFCRANLELATSIVSQLFLGEAAVDYSKLNLPRGRFDILKCGLSRRVIIDYAHTPDALEQLLKCTREVFPNLSITLIFGCGGNRDKSKRKLMGEIALNLSDKVCVTSDNPRDEKPDQIIKDICEGNMIELVEVDREKAIERMLRSQRNDEIIIIAGKGHEQYQEVRGERLSFSDYDVVKKYRTNND